MKYSEPNLQRRPRPQQGLTLPSSDQIVAKVLVSAKSSEDLLTKHEDELFDIYKNVAHPVKHTATCESICAVLEQVSILLCLDFEPATTYFKVNSPHVPRTYQMQ